MNRTAIIRGGDFQTREDGEKRYIDGYFAVFGSEYWLWDDAYETIDEGAFSLETDTDVRALTNHDTTLVLGRTKANTLELKSDSHGLWGRVKVNPKDSDAVNTYERIKRGDVDQCSIGFIIRDEETEFSANGDIHWTIKDVELFEVSVCTFPAYEETGVSARHRDAEELKKRAHEAWKLQMRDRLAKKSMKEDSDHAESVDASKED